MKKSGRFWKGIHIFKVMWKFITTEPKDRTEEEWEEALIVGEALKWTQKMSERRRKNRSLYGMRRMYSTKRRYH